MSIHWFQRTKNSAIYILPTIIYDRPEQRNYETKEVIGKGTIITLVWLCWAISWLPGFVCHQIEKGE